jgi:Asp-tRNA(Asn)/Glu-tRNA(Gln) amidotransferase A subunit family amidase
MMVSISIFISCPTDHTGVVTPTPACKRALEMAVYALESQGHTVFDVSPPSPYKALSIASQLLIADSGSTYLSHMRTFETNDPGAAQMAFYMRLPTPIRYLYYLWVRYVRRDSIWAGILRNFGPKSVTEQWKLVSEREAYRTQWWDWWNQENFDIMLTVPNATPALPHKAMHDAVSSCGYTFLFNLVSSNPSTTNLDLLTLSS